MTGSAKPEQATFLGGQVKYEEGEAGCCHSRPTRYCCIATAVLGCLVMVLGMVVLVAGQGLLEGAILKTMALSPGSDRLSSWLNPPVQAHLTTYSFHVTNPEAVMQGKKPIVKEVGPFTYKAVTVKDSVDKDTGKENLDFNEDGETLTYRPRKFYFFDRSQSVGDPDTTFITVPNIPLLTGFTKIRDMGWGKGTAADVVKNTGLGTPFINVSFSGLLWGYNDELPCLSHTRPDECGAPEGEIDIFAEDSDDEWGDDEWKRKKRSAGRYKREAEEETEIDYKNADFESMQKPKAEYVDCKCEWGLFRDRNVTLRKPVKIHHGMADLSKKGWVEEFNSSPNMNWWQPGSTCDKLGGQDGATLPPGVMKTDAMDMFISLMCRRINLEYEKDVEHLGLNSYRFIPPANAMGSHTDPDPKARNPANSCFCLKDQGFSCFKSGVLNMEPCKRSPALPKGAPIALSYPHFYQADPSFLSAVSGLSPDKEKHQFYVDVAPEFGFPLAIRPRFQLNAIIKKDEDIEMMSNFADELILPFLWAEDGFSEPSEEMAEAIKFGLSAPGKLSRLGGASLLVVGGAMLLAVLGWVLWVRRQGGGSDSLAM
eukprot:GFUD01042454.1.p1 GENE.GFUD01042454.1~~GFUD01042454.1.p1  ORF type:complete len:596 (+),score=215.72 GFUD01042454.1:176-1963(+)